MVKDCSQLYSSEKILKNILTKTSQKVCLTTYMWTSLKNLNHMVLIAHFIDDEWKLQKKILNFCQILNHNKGNTIGKIIEKCLLKWVIEILFTMAIHNASSSLLLFPI